jgi:hypothetical protein
VSIEARRARRASWNTAVVRAPFSSESADQDARSGLLIPEEQRAQAVWELSVELFDLAARNRPESAPGESIERRLPRSAYRITRR